MAYPEIIGCLLVLSAVSDAQVQINIRDLLAGLLNRTQLTTPLTLGNTTGGVNTNVLDAYKCDTCDPYSIRQPVLNETVTNMRTAVIIIGCLLALSTVSNGQINIRGILGGLLNTTQVTNLGNTTGGLPNVTTNILDGTLINVSVENVNVDASHALD
ncbi:unnamed protein product [Chrysodeixis includens]|uniref:Uncharacterized protein n=1 Tax=Chrysodeixis includens TaxID=689277 RepID=A0A9N8KW12_CHRIL|nr:unnamed protein product [Chrysodeixis includens]